MAVGDPYTDTRQRVAMDVGHHTGDSRSWVQVGINACERAPSPHTYPAMLGQEVARDVAEATGIELNEISPACQAVKPISAVSRGAGIGEVIADVIRGFHADSGQRLAGCARRSHDACD